MRLSLYGALPCLLMVQAAAQTPLTFAHLQAKARPAPGQWRAEALITEHQLQLQESRGFLREGPTLALSAGPRRSPGAPGTTDRGFEVDLPLFLAPSIRAGLSASLGQAHPLLVEAARREDRLRLRSAYLDAWLASRLISLGQAELATVERWFQTAQARFEAGADPAYQVALVESERLKVQQELDEARAQEALAWGTLAALTDLPSTPVPLADPGPVPEFPPGELALQLQEGPLRKALVAQADLEERSLRLKEAQTLSRWSLRGSFAQEGEEKVTRLGLAVRLPRLGERAAIRRGTETRIRAVQGQARQTLAELDARAAGAVARLRLAPGTAPLPDFTQAIAAVGLRLQEGRERPSEALPIRRQLLEGQKASLRRLHTQHLLAAELQTLMPEVHP
jgi:outer membrane protein TolC